MIQLSRHTRRFTLIELLLVMGIIAVLAGMVAPRLSGSLRKGRLDSQARAVIALSRKARALAAAEGRTYDLVVDRSGRTLQLTRRRDPLAEAGKGDDPEREEVSEDHSWARAVPFEADVKLAEILLADEAWVPAEGAADDTLVVPFRPDGTTPDRVSLSFQLDDDLRRVEVDPHLGQARIVDDELGSTP